MPAIKLLIESVNKRITIIRQIIRNKTAAVLNFICLLKGIYKILFKII